MNYLKIYNQLVEKRKINPAIGNTEKHHILPKSLFPQRSKDKANLVILTVRQHYIAHWLLTKIYKDNSKMWFAFWSMNNRHIYKNSKAFERMRLEAKKHYSGQNNPMYGKRGKETGMYGIKPPNIRSVRLIQFNIVFQSMTEAASLFGITKQAISYACKNKTICKGYHFEYVEKNNHQKV